MRQKFTLNDSEQRAFYNLRPLPGEAFDFWRRVANLRGLDVASIISDRETFSGLPLGHGKRWCFPFSLHCKFRPVP